MSVYNNINGVFSELGKPYIKLEFDDNEALLDFQKRMNENGEAVELEYKNGEFAPVENLSGYGDEYTVIDNRKRARKEPGELLANKNLSFRKKGQAAENYNHAAYNSSKYKIIHLTTNFDGLYAEFWIFKAISRATENTKTDYINSIKQGADGKYYKGTIIREIVKANIKDLYNITGYMPGKKQAYVTNEIYKKYYDDALKLFFDYLKRTIKYNQEEIEKYNNNKYKYKYDTSKLEQQYESNLKEAQKEYNYNIAFYDYKGGDLGAPGDVYLVTDTRKNPRKELDETAIFKKFNVEKYTDSGDGWEAVKLIDIKTISKDPARFQNRDTAESSESVNRIIKDVEKGRFDWAKFDPIVVWRDPQNKKLFVLSGHSRTKAFEELSKAGATASGKDFTKIPAKLFQGDEASAIDFALNSNTLSTKESDIERANYYRNKRKSDTPETQIIEEIKNNEGKNWTRIWAFSHLLKDGFTNSALKALQNSSSENAEIIKIVAEWIGKIFAQYPFLTAEHDKEIYKFLITEGAYGKGAGKINNYQTLREKVAKAIERRTEFGKFNSGARLNLWNLNESSNNMRVFDEKKANLTTELRAAIKELNEKRKIFFQRAKADKSITNKQINKALQPYQDNVNLLQRRLIELESNKNQYAIADRQQQALVFEGGIGKTANPYLYNDNSIIDCRGLKPTYEILNDYSQFFNVANDKTTFSGFGLDDTKKLIADTCRKYWKDCKMIAAHLKGDCLLQSCFNLWHWLRYNIRYEYDKEGREEVRTPLRTWQDRARGVDCDCLSVFAWCVLKCMGYDPAFELAAFKNREQFSHIYINCDGVLVDRVWFVFNSRPPLVTKTELFRVDLLPNLGYLF